MNSLPLLWCDLSGKSSEDSLDWRCLFYRIDPAPVSKEIMAEKKLFLKRKNYTSFNWMLKCQFYNQ
jgi:hypothetical protein